MKKQSDLINYMKGFSIVSIVLYHLVTYYSTAPSLIKTASKFGGAGVYIFLICSGFGLYYSSTFNKLDWLSFIKKRLNKVYFPYIIIILISTFFPFMYKGTDKLQAFMSHVFLYKMFFERYESSFGVQFWFISTIIQFYLVFNILCIIKNKLGNSHFLALSIATSILWSTFITFANLNEYRIWSSFFLQYTWCFSLGMVIGDWYSQNRTFPKKLSNISILLPSFFILFFIYSGMSLIGGPFKSFNDFFSMGAFLTLILMIYKITFLKPIIKYISNFSYELFLVHIIIFSITFNVFSNLFSNSILCFISFFICLAIADLYHKILNKGYTHLTKH